MNFKLPFLLIYYRLIAGVLIFLLPLFSFDKNAYLSIFLLISGLLSDIFDGIIARKQGIVTIALRRLDSTVDQAFYIFTAVALYIRCPEFFSTHRVSALSLISSEIIIYLISFLKFRKEVATHTYGAKIWSLLLVAVLFQLFLTCDSTILYRIMWIVGIITRIEIGIILLILKNWKTDVNGLFLLKKHVK